MNNIAKTTSNKNIVKYSSPILVKQQMNSELEQPSEDHLPILYQEQQMFIHKTAALIDSSINICKKENDMKSFDEGAVEGLDLLVDNFGSEEAIKKIKSMEMRGRSFFVKLLKDYKSPH